MTRPTDIIVTGFTKSAALAQKSFASLRRMKQEGVVRAIRYVTWDTPELDAHVAPVAAMPEVEMTRVPQPQAVGNANQKGLVWQVRNLEAALALVPEADALVFKTRPDYVIASDFLRRKIETFDRYGVIEPGASAFGVRLRRPPFSRKIWIPWADANQPFFFEDAAFAGLKRDLAHLVTPDLDRHLPALADPAIGPFAHVVRYASAVLPRFAIFQRYLAEYAAFANDTEYRKNLLVMALDDAFFWMLLVANAWILHTGFHIDAGRPGDLTFYANNANRTADWSNLAVLANAAPYDDVAGWRANAKAGQEVFAGVGRRYGRLLDDAWPRALFTQRFADVPPETLQQLATSLAGYETGLLKELEDGFYAKLAAYRRENWPSKQVAA